MPDVRETPLEEICRHNRINWVSADNAQALADKLATHIASRLQRRLDNSGAASLVVSGGSTPAPVFAQLSTIDIDWANVYITLADERWVPPGHADSNESLVRRTLMVNKATAARFVPLYRKVASAEDALADVRKDLIEMPTPFTVVILGMGGDGHTASLFPDAPGDELHLAMQLDNDEVVAILHPPSVSQTRISLTRAALLSAEERIVHITGESKYPVLQQALVDTLKPTDDGNLTLAAYMPGHKPIAGLISHDPEAVSVYWSC